MSVTKRIITASVCAALLIAGGVVGIQANTECAGAGNGTDAKIEKLETLKDVIDSLGEMQRSESSYSLVRSDGVRGDESEYTSCTVVEISDVYYKSEASSKDYSSSSRMDFTRTLTMYYGENASFYVSDLQCSSSSSYSSGSVERKTKSALDFSVKVYVAQDCAMIYLNRLNYSYSQKYSDNQKPEEDYSHTEKDTVQGRTFGVLKEYCNRWIDCSEEPSVIRSFLDVDSGNLKTLASFGNLIGQQTSSEESGIKQSGNVYTLKESTFLDFFGLSGYDKNVVDVDGKCTIDLSSKSKPEISYWLSASAEKNYSYVNDRIIFKNINNTVVNKPKGNTVSFKTVDDRVQEMEDDD